MSPMQLLRRRTRAIAVAILAAAMLLSGAGVSFAHEQVMVIRQLPRGYRTVRMGRAEYYVHGGRFYARRPGGGFVVVGAPIGVIVATLPVGFVTVFVGGVDYYLYEGVYYRKVPEGYMVVAPPAPQPQQPVPIQAASGTAIVQTTLLNVRSGPATTYAVIGLARMGERLTISGSVPGWYYVQLSDGRMGWVMTQFTTVEQPAPQG